MRDLLRQYPEALIIALVGHALLIAALIIGADFGRAPTEQASPDVGETRETVEAVAVEPEAVDRAMARIEEQEREEEAERERLAEERRAEEERLEQLRAERERLEQERRQAAQEELEQARREAEQMVAEAEREAEEARAQAERERREAEEAAEQARREAEQAAEQARREAEEAERRAEEERQRREEEERKRREEERRQAELEAEQEAREQAEREAQERAEREARERELDRLGSQYKNAIRAHVQQNWRQPSAFEAGNRAAVVVRQIPSGDVTDVRIEDCEGSRSFCESVEAAVRRASPLPEAPDDEVFSREIRFDFNPES